MFDRSKYSLSAIDPDIAAAQWQRSLDARRQRRTRPLAQWFGQIERRADKIGSQLQQGR